MTFLLLNSAQKVAFTALGLVLETLQFRGMFLIGAFSFLLGGLILRLGRAGT